MYAVLLAKQNEAHLIAASVVNTRALSELVRAGIFVDVERDEYQQDLQSDADRYLRHAQSHTFLLQLFANFLLFPNHLC